MSNPIFAASAGLEKVAEAISRSAALNVAMSITPPESSIEDLLRTADTLLDWVQPDEPDERTPGW